MGKSLRILHLIYDNLDNPWLGGGGAKRTAELYSRIARRGHRVTVVTGRYPGAPRARVRSGVVYRHIGSGASYVLSRVTYVLAAARLLRRRGYDIVIEDVSPFSPVGSPLWIPQVPAVASVQNLSGRHATAKYGLAGWGPRLAEQRLLALFSNFIAVSPGIAAQLAMSAREGARVRVIPNSAGFMCERQLTPDDRRPVTDEHNTQYGEYILALGRIDVYQKGLDRLVEAFDLVAGQLPALRLRVAGTGTEAQIRSLQALVAKSKHHDRIELLGHVPPDRAAELLRGAVALAMPSRYEAWPLTAIEAAAVGVPVVGSDIVGVRDAAPQFPAAHGELVPQGDARAFSRALYRIATDRELRREMGARGREWAARFTWDALAEEQLAFYEEVVRSSEF